MPQHRKKSPPSPNFKSKLEEKFWDELRIHFQQHVTYETEKLDYVLPARKYVPDFVIHRSDGSKTYIEVKGYLRPADRTKMAAVKRHNPDADIRFIFAANNKVNGTKMRYSDWAIKYGFPFAIGKVPHKWIKK